MLLLLIAQPWACSGHGMGLGIPTGRWQLWAWSSWWAVPPGKQHRLHTQEQTGGWKSESAQHKLFFATVQCILFL